MLQFSAMSPDASEPVEKQGQSTFRYTLAAVTGQVGCLTSFLLLAALFGGIWLDNYFDTKPIFTIGLIILSVPITIVAMVWIVKKTTSRMQSVQRAENRSQFMEENQSG
jgi:F0F1-type ATP synthase assembly protein I